MTVDIGILGGIILVAMVLFSIEWISADIVALGVLLALLLTGLISPEEAFSGFGSETVIMILSLLLLTAALRKTGVVDIAGIAIVKVAGARVERLFAGIVIASAVLSAFISNTAATAFLLPLATGIAAKANISPSRILMPMAFASICSSSVTLISTSTNLVVSGLMTQHALRPLGLFELAVVGIPIASVSVVYLLTVAPRIIPERVRPGSDVDRFELKSFLTEVLVTERSSLVGKTLGESRLGRDLDLTILGVVRGEERIMGYRPGLRLRTGDVLLVEGVRENILKVKDQAGIDIRPEVTLPNPDLESEDMRLVEIILMPGSPLIGRTLASERFRQRYGLQVLAVNRHHGVIRSKLGDVRLRLGDVLLVQGHRMAITALEDERVSRVIGVVPETRQNRRRAPVAIAVFVGALACASLGLVPLPVAALLGAFMAFATGCVTPEEAYREVPWRVIILIACILGLGIAMQRTGAAAFAAQKIVAFTSTMDARVILAGFFLLAVLLTQPMSNAAAAAVLVPIAIQTAIGLDFDPRPFAVIVAIAASCSYLTPLEPACLLVLGPGRYRVRDFAVVGAPLTAIIFALAIWLVPIFWPLNT